MTIPSWGGQLCGRVTDFARLLRGAGLSTGPGDVLNALNALAAVDVTRPEQFYWALHAVFVRCGEDRALFHEAFTLFWATPAPTDAMTETLLSHSKLPRERPEPLRRRLAEAWGKSAPVPREGAEGVEGDCRMTYSAREALGRKDFEQMSLEELEAAREAIARIRLPVPDQPTRRRRPRRRGAEVDLRRTLKASLRGGGATIRLQWQTRRRVPPPLVVLCDVSGSMSGYTRMLLHFLHTLTNHRDRVHTFLLGTRLTNATRYLRGRDVDAALERLGRVVEDWDGGTRIGLCLDEFNRSWSRRVLGQGAVVLLITDGLDREGVEVLASAMDRLHRSCRRLIWLNPLLRYEDFEPEARGIRAILPHVDDFRPVHTLDSLRDLAAALSQPAITPVRTASSATSGAPWPRAGAARAPVALAR